MHYVTVPGFEEHRVEVLLCYGAAQDRAASPRLGPLGATDHHDGSGRVSGCPHSPLALALTLLVHLLTLRWLLFTHARARARTHTHSHTLRPGGHGSCPPPLPLPLVWFFDVGLCLFEDGVVRRAPTALAPTSRRLAR